jgi:hypothetical protein
VTEPRENFILQKPCKRRGQEVEIRNHHKNGARPAKPKEQGNLLSALRSGRKMKQKNENEFVLEHCYIFARSVPNSGTGCPTCGVWARKKSL